MIRLTVLILAQARHTQRRSYGAFAGSQNGTANQHFDVLEDLKTGLENSGANATISVVSSKGSARIGVEHTLSRRKKYAIASAVYRNADQDYDSAMNVVSGLVNLRAFDQIFQRTGLDI